ncbi:S41 family peptidase [Sphingobacterium kitahiroshimense]|uniref:S41 family peptidase n=1 Tax=Sphingobacterium kitahiroshimense TaxID=470446 RepID=A0ABV0BZ86_9SPHI
MTSSKKRCLIFFKLLPITALIFSCKKNKFVDSDVSPKTGSRTELTIDSLYLYAKEIYLWNETLPDYHVFSPRDRYSDIIPEINALKKELFDISQIKINQSTKLPYEFTYYGLPKYSFLDQIRTVKLKGANDQVVQKDDIIFSQIDNLSYLAIHTFPQLSSVKTDLNVALSEIAKHNPKTIVIDLRYNSGGYIETAEYLANLISPSSLNGKVMYSESFNSTLKSGNLKLLKNQPYLDNNGNYVTINGRQATMADVDYSENGNTYFFKKVGNLESVKNIYFIISSVTASASELLISSFKPYLNVKIVGEKTYGKPVGSFSINIDDYSIYLSSFLIKNGQGWSDYFNGIDPNIKVLMPSNPNLGDPEEACLKSILLDLNLSQVKTIEKNFKRQVRGENFQSNKKDIRNFLLENRLKLKN